MPLTLYHSRHSRSVRPLWLCHEIGLEIDVVDVELNRKALSSAEHLKLHPLGKIPVLVDGDTTLWESLAIMDYIMGKNDNALARGPNDPDYAEYLKWYHFGEASLGPYVTMALGHNTLLPEPMRIPAMAEWGKREAEKCFNAMATPLSKHDYLLPTGFCAADISCAYMLLLAKFGKIFDVVPAPVQSYWERIMARPGWQSATAKR